MLPGHAGSKKFSKVRLGWRVLEEVPWLTIPSWPDACEWQGVQTTGAATVHVGDKAAEIRIQHADRFLFVARSGAGSWRSVPASHGQKPPLRARPRSWNPVAEGVQFPHQTEVHRFALQVAASLVFDKAVADCEGTFCQTHDLDDGRSSRVSSHVDTSLGQEWFRQLSSGSVSVVAAKRDGKLPVTHRDDLVLGTAPGRTSRMRENDSAWESLT